LQKEIDWLFREKYQGRATKDFYKDIKKLKQGEPIDYVIGFTEFLGYKIDLSKKPLIPRAETEFWVKTVVEEINQSKNPTSLHSSRQNLRILDIFAGSGCVGIAIIKHIKNSKVDFIDNSINCIEQIKINLELNKINKNRYKIIQSDVFLNIEGKYDFILANPPYIAIRNKNKIQKSVLKYEPHKALFGGKDGIFYIRKFLKEAKNYLKNNGKIYMEFDYVQKKEIEKLIKKYKYSVCKFNKDQYGKWRWVMIK
jgi:release factor glutamine methyltransferase